MHGSENSVSKSAVYCFSGTAMTYMLLLLLLLLVLLLALRLVLLSLLLSS